MTNFREVLQALEEREIQLLQELKDIHAAKPAIERLAQSPTISASSVSGAGEYAGFGTKEALLMFLGSQDGPLSVAEITKGLIAGGIKTNSRDFSAVVKSTLANLKAEGKVHRKEDGWVSTDARHYAPSSNESQQPFSQSHFSALG